jgi:hypothetical protein
MEVIDHGPHAWFLVRDGDALLLDARCSHGPAEYSVVIELDEAERQAYTARAKVYVDQLAQAIHESAPGVQGSTSPYRSRILGPARANQVQQTILVWVEAHR